MLSVALALLIAQVISVVLLVRASDERRESAAVTTLAFRLINGAARAERDDGQSDRPFLRRQRLREQRRALLEAGGPLAQEVARDRLPGRIRYIETPERPLAIDQNPSRSDLEKRLGEVLEREGIEPHALALVALRASDDPMLQRIAQLRPRLAAGREWREREILVASIQREAGGSWESARLFVPPRPAGGLGLLLLPALVTFALLVVILFFVLRRITRPLAALTARVEEFSRDPEAVVELAETGPEDTRRLIAAHNAMEARIAALLDEKDVMLGAIGHDLKTPLAALRVRIESVADEAQRSKMAQSIEDITETLDDILTLARLGRKGAQDAKAQTETVDLGALAGGVVEEFEDMGEPVAMLEFQRLVARVQVTWIKRALRNLITNALRYAGPTTVSMVRGENHAILRVEDEGPGIPEEELAQMLEPFARGEASRNRATGGTGLGLTLARAIAEAHGGSLVLTNREEAGPNKGGLRAEIRLPLSR